MSKCFVHVGLDPYPKVVNGPCEAISLAERYLQGMNDREFSIYWRRDDLYPNNFVPYSQSDLVAEIQKEGELTLQLAKVTGDALPIRGETATIFSAAEEERNAREAEDALSLEKRNGKRRLRGLQNLETTAVGGGSSPARSQCGVVS